MDKQTDLFDPRPAVVIAFPPANRKDLIRAMCTKLVQLQSVRERDAHWRKVIHGLRQDYQALGIQPSEVERLLLAFKAACEAEQVRRYVVGHRVERDRKP